MDTVTRFRFRLSTFKPVLAPQPQQHLSETDPISLDILKTCVQGGGGQCTPDFPPLFRYLTAQLGAWSGMLHSGICFNIFCLFNWLFNIVYPQRSSTGHFGLGEDYFFFHYCHYCICITPFLQGAQGSISGTSSQQPCEVGEVEREWLSDPGAPNQL